jgi:hypothetical protein
MDPVGRGQVWGRQIPAPGRSSRGPRDEFHGVHGEVACTSRCAPGVNGCRERKQPINHLDQAAVELPQHLARVVAAHPGGVGGVADPDGVHEAAGATGTGQ